MLTGGWTVFCIISFQNDLTNAHSVSAQRVRTSWKAIKVRSNLKTGNVKIYLSASRCTFSAGQQQTFQTLQHTRRLEVHLWKHRNVSFLLNGEKKTMWMEMKTCFRGACTVNARAVTWHDHIHRRLWPPRTNPFRSARFLCIGHDCGRQQFLLSEIENISLLSAKFGLGRWKRRISIEFILTTICNGTEIPKNPKKATHRKPTPRRAGSRPGRSVSLPRMSAPRVSVNVCFYEWNERKSKANDREECGNDRRREKSTILWHLHLESEFVSFLLASQYYRLPCVHSKKLGAACAIDWDHDTSTFQNWLEIAATHFRRLNGRFSWRWWCIFTSLIWLCNFWRKTSI